MRGLETRPEPVLTVDQFRRAASFDGEEDDDTIAMFIEAATDVVETATRRPLMPRDVEFAVPEGDWQEWWLPVAPVLSVLDAGAGELRNAFDEPRLLRGSGLGATLRVRVGYEIRDQVPPALVNAVILLAKEWLDFGMALPGDGSALPPLSFGAIRLIKQRRYKRPMEVR